MRQTTAQKDLVEFAKGLLTSWEHEYRYPRGSVQVLADDLRRLRTIVERIEKQD